MQNVRIICTEKVKLWSKWYFMENKTDR